MRMRNPQIIMKEGLIMTNKRDFTNSESQAEKEIRYWKERAERAEKENKKLRNKMVEINFDRFTGAQVWQNIARELASELEYYLELYTQKEIELRHRKNAIKQREGERNYWWDRAGELAEALEHLRDLQNGPPLLKKEQEWKQLMEKIDQLLEDN